LRRPFLRESTDSSPTRQLPFSFCSPPHGFEVVVAADGAGSLQKFDEVAPDLALLDVMLPKISGIDVCRQLRKRT
jgi:DNA-binding response OmpR family regulator